MKTDATVLVDAGPRAIVSADDVRVGGQWRVGLALPIIVEHRQYVAHAFQTRLFLIVGADNDPGAVRGMRLAKHLFFVLRVQVPVFLGLFVNRTYFPLFKRVETPRLKALLLHFFGDREPKFHNSRGCLRTTCAQTPAPAA